MFSHQLTNLSSLLSLFLQIVVFEYLILPSMMTMSTWMVDRLLPCHSMMVVVVDVYINNKHPFCYCKMNITCWHIFLKLESTTRLFCIQCFFSMFQRFFQSCFTIITGLISQSMKTMLSVNYGRRIQLSVPKLWWGVFGKAVISKSVGDVWRSPSKRRSFSQMKHVFTPNCAISICE